MQDAFFDEQFYKIKNNESCLCGSGKKYASCCKGKLNQRPPEYSEDILTNINRISHIIYEKYVTTDFKDCLYPKKQECVMPIKRAHTLQNNGVLSLLAENDHVMIVDLFNQVRENSIIKLESKNKATTFYGFCHEHDTKVFQEIETQPYIKTEKQNFLYAYRACAQEYHKKKRLIVCLQNIVKENPSILKRTEFLIEYRMKQLDFFDINQSLHMFNKAIIDDCYDILENLVIDYPMKVDFAVTTAFEPAIDLEDQTINDIFSFKKERLKGIFLTIFPQGQKSIIIISYFKKDKHSLKNYIKQINSLNSDMLKNYLNNLIPTFSENIVLSPRLWNKFTNYSKKNFEQTISGEFGDFKEMLSRKKEDLNFDKSIDKFEFATKTNDLLKKPKYDLFK